MAKEINEFFLAFGINLIQGYGLTEFSRYVLVLGGTMANQDFAVPSFPCVILDYLMRAKYNSKVICVWLVTLIDPKKRLNVY